MRRIIIYLLCLFFTILWLLVAILVLPQAVYTMLKERGENEKKNIKNV